MDLMAKIKLAIREVANTRQSFDREQYEDNYDGFTHSTYAGLADDVWEEMDNEGEKNPSKATIEEYVFQMM